MNRERLSFHCWLCVFHIFLISTGRETHTTSLIPPPHKFSDQVFLRESAVFIREREKDERETLYYFRNSFLDFLFTLAHLREERRMAIYTNPVIKSWWSGDLAQGPLSLSLSLSLSLPRVLRNANSSHLLTHQPRSLARSFQD